MATYFDVFNIKSDLQFNDIMNNLDLTSNEMFALDDIINSHSPISYKREKILEMFSGTNNYDYCKKLFLKEDNIPSQLNMNQTIELNKLFELASEKFKKVNCSQQFYQILTQKTSKDCANAFFNMLKSIPEDSNCRFDPQLVINGKNFAQTILPYVNELTTFLNGCKSESKKEEVNEDYDADKLSKIDHQIAQLENNIKKFEQEKNSYLDEYSKLEYKLDKVRLRKLKAKREEILNESIENKLSGVYNIKNGSFKSFKDENDKLSIDDYKNRLVNYEILPDKKLCVITAWSYADAFNTRIAISKKYPEENKNIEKWKLIFFQNGDGSWDEPLKKYIEILDRNSNTIKESIETQPDMFGGRDTYYKDGIEALDFDNVLDAMAEIAPDMGFVNDTHKNGKYSMIFQPNSSAIELNQKGYKKIKKFMEEKFGKENIAVRLAHAQYAPEIKKLYVTFINQIDVQNELNESEISDTLESLKYHVSVTSDKKTLEDLKEKFSNYFNKTKDTEDRNKLSELLSMINSKLNKIKPRVDECSDLESLLEPFKATVVNITVNDDGCLEDVEKESATNNLKALASHINDKKDCCEENNIENMQTIMSLLSSLSNYFHKKLCESVEDNKLPNGEYTVVAYNIIVDEYFEGEYNLHEKKVLKINHKAGRDLDKEIKEAIIEDMGAGGDIKVVDYDYQIVDNVADDELFESVDRNMEDAIESVNAQIDDFGSYDDEYVRSCCEDVAEEKGLDVKKLYYYVTNRKWSVWDKDEDYEELNESYDEKYNDISEELNDIKQDYLNNELDVYDATNAVDNLIGNKSEAEAIVDSWDDPSKHGLYGITDDEELDEDTVYDHSWYEVKGQKYPKRTKNGVEINEMCSGGACCAGAVANVPSPAKPKTPKKKHKKSKVDEMALNMFKRHIIEDVNSQIDANGNHYEYRDGYFYINGDIARTKSKYQMLEALDEMIELDTLKGFNSNEMLMLEDIEASGNVGNADDNNQNNNNNSNNNADNNNNQQNANQTPNQDNLGDVNQNVTQDSDLTPQQRQLKKDTEQVLDQSMSSNTDTNVTLNQGMDNNNDQTTNNQTTSTNNVKYKVIGKDDSDTNNIKYIIQDPNTKQTQIVDATKLRLEK